MASSEKGVPYFPLECSLDTNFRLVEATFGIKGFAIVIKLLQKIYGECGYYLEWSQDVGLLFSSEIKEGYNLVSEVIVECLKREIFDKSMYDEYSIITSHGIQKRYMRIVERRVNVEMIKEYVLLSDDEIKPNVCINSKNVYRNSEYVQQKQTKESKVKESKVKDIKDICSELPAVSTEPPIITLILNDKSEHIVYQSNINEWQELFPSVDIMQSLRNMRAWCIANPNKRKTKRGINKFIISWLSREQDKPKHMSTNNVQRAF